MKDATGLLAGLAVALGLGICAAGIALAVFETAAAAMGCGGGVLAVGAWYVFAEVP